MEQWRSIEGSPNYAVSSEGRVRNDRTGRILNYCHVNGGYVQVGISIDGVRSKVYVSHLVARTFLPLPKNSQQNSTIIHLDGDHDNCRVSNLMWRPRWFAQQYTRQFRMLRHKTSDRKIRDRETGEVVGIWDIVTKDGLLYNDVVRCINDSSAVWPTMKLYEWAGKKV